MLFKGLLILVPHFLTSRRSITRGTQVILFLCILIINFLSALQLGHRKSACCWADHYLVNKKQQEVVLQPGWMTRIVWVIWVTFCLGHLSIWV